MFCEARVGHRDGSRADAAPAEPPAQQPQNNAPGQDKKSGQSGSDNGNNDKSKGNDGK